MRCPKCDNDKWYCIETCLGLISHCSKCLHEMRTYCPMCDNPSHAQEINKKTFEMKMKQIMRIGDYALVKVFKDESKVQDRTEGTCKT